MAERRVNIPGVRARFVKQDQTIDPVWHRFLIDLYERTGGGAFDKIEDIATGGGGTGTGESAITKDNQLLHYWMAE